MRHSVSEARKKASLRIIFDSMPDLGTNDIIISEFVNWQPLYDLFIIKEKVVVTIEIPGVDVKDFSVYVCRGYMVIDGYRKSPSWLDRNCCTFHNFEIPYGRFIRRIEFPLLVEPKQYQHVIENGILTLTFPIEKEKIIPIEEE
jgi:HSP20 family molecular chaperone IbpA